MLTVSGECRELSFPASFSFTAKRLQNHTIRTQQVPDVNSCERLCFWESNCVSINFKEKTRSCELNNATHRGYGYHLEDNADYVYHGADVEYIIRFRFTFAFSQTKSEALLVTLKKCLSEVKFSKPAIS